MGTLVQPVPLVAADDLGAAHFVAVGGAGMSGIAQLFAQRGIETSGCDQAASHVLDLLQAAGVTTYVGHDPAHLDGVQTVIVSSAIKPTNVEYAAAVSRGMPVLHRSVGLAALMVGHTGISVSGTHGKTTTSGMVAVMLAAAGADPSYVIGSPLADTGVTAHSGAGRPFVIEADESDGSFRQYPTEIAVVTNIEADHLDTWGTPEAYAAGYREFAGATGVRTVIACADDPGSAELAAWLRDQGRRVITVGTAETADVRIIDPDPAHGAPTATIVAGAFTGRLALRVPGVFNLLNAGLAFAVGFDVGIAPDALLAGLAQFSGTLRRFQPIGEAAGVRVFDDYAHHPTEIAATLKAARAVADDGRVVACFQPHLYSRTRTFADAFGEALSLADLVVVTDVYGAREAPEPGVTGELVADAARRHGAAVTYVAALADVPQSLGGLVRRGDLVLTIGAGSITTVGPKLVDVLGGAS